MSWISTGTLARNFVMTQQNKLLSSQLNTLAQELSTGQVADIGRTVHGDYAPLAQIRHGLKTLESFDLAGQEATLRTDMLQASLTRISDSVDGLSGDLLIASNVQESGAIETAGLQARAALDQIVSALNTDAAGRSLFSGAATDGPAIASADTLLQELQTATAGLTTADDVLAAVDTWFDLPGGGFSTTGYLGSDTAAGAARLAEDQSLSLSITASDAEIRDALKSVAGAALMADPTVLAGSLEERSALITQSATRALNAIPALTALSGEVGVTQQRIETIQAENAAKRHVLELDEANLIAADPYETATKLEAVEGQLEMHYAITARLSRLSLVDYI